jgi:tetratricopeptide (TPR) repeat protein
MRLKNTDALIRQAAERHVGGRLKEAFPLYDAALRLDPKLAAAHCNRAIALQSLNRLDEASSSFDRERSDPITPMRITTRPSHSSVAEFLGDEK